jgi:hypothetical protein
MDSALCPTWTEPRPASSTEAGREKCRALLAQSNMVDLSTLFGKSYSGRCGGDDLLHEAAREPSFSTSFDFRLDRLDWLDRYRQFRDFLRPT